MFRDDCPWGRKEGGEKPTRNWAGRLEGFKRYVLKGETAHFMSRSKIG
jgi:hypothetical protein